MDILATPTDPADITGYPENCLKMILCGKEARGLVSILKISRIAGINNESTKLYQEKTIR